VFRNLKTAQEALDEWEMFYNTQRPHQALGDITPRSRFTATDRQPMDPRTPRPERNGEQWVCRKVASNGVVSVEYQQVSCAGVAGMNRDTGKGSAETLTSVCRHAFVRHQPNQHTNLAPGQGFEP
jgi:hypothetical protein